MEKLAEGQIVVEGRHTFRFSAYNTAPHVLGDTSVMRALTREIDNKRQPVTLDFELRKALASEVERKLRRAITADIAPDDVRFIASYEGTERVERALSE